VGYRFGASTYTIACRNAASVAAAGVVVDGQATLDDTIAIIDGDRKHSVVVNLARRTIDVTVLEKTNAAWNDRLCGGASRSPRRVPVF
jgi:hypothetical protein